LIALARNPLLATSPRTSAAVLAHLPGANPELARSQPSTQSVAAAPPRRSRRRTGNAARPHRRQPRRDARLSDVSFASACAATRDEPAQLPRRHDEVNATALPRRFATVEAATARRSPVYPAVVGFRGRRDTSRQRRQARGSSAARVVENKAGAGQRRDSRGAREADGFRC
jgi:hypothetical protein